MSGAPKPGDRVRVTLEGAASMTDAEGRFWVGDNLIDARAATVTAIELLPSPEPEWVDWEVALDRHDVPHRRLPIDFYGANTGVRWQRFGGVHLSDEDMHRPLRRLVPEDRV